MRNALIALTVFASACCTSMTSDISRGDAEVAIGKYAANFNRAVNAGDAAGMTEMYADDAVLMAPNMPAFKGRDAIGRFWSGFVASGKVVGSVGTDDVVQSGDLATEIGHYEFTLTPPAGAPRHDKGKYVITWRKVGGRWQAVSDIYNSDLAAQ